MTIFGIADSADVLTFVAKLGLALVDPVHVHTLPQATMCHIFDKANCPHVGAVFLEAKHGVIPGHIYLSERADLATVNGRSILIHELVHVYQMRSGRYAYESCWDHHAAEAMAYATQNAYLAHHGKRPVATLLPDCTNEKQWKPYVQKVSKPTRWTPVK